MSTIPKTLLIQLVEDEPQTRERAAITLYRDSESERVFNFTANEAEAIRRSVELGNRNAAALLMMGRIPGAESQELLRQVRNTDGAGLTKVENWAPAVPVAFVVDVAFSHLGDTDARARLLAWSAQQDLGTLRFVLSELAEIDDPTLLRAIAQSLDDEREVPEGVPSGAAPRRVCDSAVDAFVQRLSLQPSFALHSARRYEASNIAEIKAQLDAVLPQ